MSVKLAETAGFCMGVRRAMDKVLDIAQHPGKGPIYTYGALIHNPQTVELLKKRGIFPLDRLEDLDRCGADAALVIRAHGITPEERRKIKEKRIRIVDATCPKVAHVQAIIKKHAARGYTTLIIGDKGHPEVNGLMGYTCSRGIVISTPEEVDSLPDLDKVCVVAQTTQNTELFNDTVKKIRTKFPHAVVFYTICDSTEKRQTEIKDLASHMDAVVIVGGKNSANTRRLASLAESRGIPAFHIETAEELNQLPLEGFEKIGVSAGASTPNWIIDRVVDSITSYQAGGGNNTRRFFKAWLFTVRTDIYSALGAGGLALACILLQDLEVHILNILIASLYVYAMHIINRLLNRKASIIGSFREESYRKHERLYGGAAALSLALALVFSFAAGAAPFILLSLISLLGVLYNAKILPKSWRFGSLIDLPASKNISVALAWAAVTALLPRMEIALSMPPATVVAFLFTFAVVFIRSSLSDILDIQNDRLIGRETIPVLFGKERTLRLLKVLWILVFILLVASFSAGWTSSLSLALAISLFYVLICFKLCDRRAGFSGIELEGLVETTYIVAGLSALLWWFFVGGPVFMQQ
ncbi:MAG: 4-hydroxy-3-methylbut-2-enyl diphosphate reductase [Deltaproteobacteria bacterium]|nr:4-hydroxy-3-methylbut-2-enyl diphosphate reductase [Deltaproteobacteria bacterium]